MNISETAKKSIAFYGGRSLWQSAKYLTAQVKASGLAFTLKCRPYFSHAKLVQKIDRPFSKLTPIGKDPSITGVLDGQDVRLENKDGEIISKRKNARDLFTVGRRFFYWDDLDMAYFANYAFWNYFTLPALLMRDDITWKEFETGLLEAKFPDGIPTHCRVQQFRFDPHTGHLIQHNYTADIISKFAKAANVVLRHSKNEDGLLYPSARQVTPRRQKGAPFNFPILIFIEVLNFRLLHEDVSGHKT